MEYTAAPQISDTSLTIAYNGFDYNVDIKTPEGLAQGKRKPTVRTEGARLKGEMCRLDKTFDFPK